MDLGRKGGTWKEMEGKGRFKWYRCSKQLSKNKVYLPALAWVPCIQLFWVLLCLPTPRMVLYYARFHLSVLFGPKSHLQVAPSVGERWGFQWWISESLPCLWTLTTRLLPTRKWGPGRVWGKHGKGEREWEKKVRKKNKRRTLHFLPQVQNLNTY